MKIFVHEYITGGGLINEVIPAALAYEGELMLAALLNDLLDIEAIEVCITRDARLRLDDKLYSHARLTIVNVSSQEQFDQYFAEMMVRCEAVWPIAPETDNILENICARVEKAKKILLSSPSIVVKLVGNKLMTCNCLNGKGIAAVNSVLIDSGSSHEFYPGVFKPIDGVGCEDSYLIENREDYQRLVLEHDEPAQMILQPFIAGPALSLSALFCNGHGQLVSCNEQKTEIIKQQFKLRECRVNIMPEKLALYQCLVEQIAQAIPELWGYAGIDLIASKSGPVVLEINPRLTTSYAGLSEALNMNMAKTILDLLDKPIGMHITTGKPVTVKFTNERT
jgi:predicted ATP-grasp superfamily ATP-dependent carboligase